MGATSTLSAQGMRSAAHEARRPIDIRLEAMVGYTTGQVSGFAEGLGVHVAYGYFQAGGVAHVGCAFSLSSPAPSFFSVAANAGLRFQTSDLGRRARFDLLFTTGAHGYNNIGARGSLFGGESSRGASALLGFVGARVGVAYEAGSRFTIGAAFFYEADLERRYAIGTPTSPTDLGGINVGGHQMGVVLTIGFRGGTPPPHT